MEAEAQTPQTDEETVARITNKPEVLQILRIQQQGIAHTCNYCHKKASVFLWSFTKTNMETYTYQLLLHRGWTRCGTMYYKSNLKKSCCKLYGHRLEVANFLPKKDQKKVLKKLITLTLSPQKIIQGQQIVAPQKNKKEKPHPNKKESIIKIQHQTQLQLLNVCLQITNSLKPQLLTLLKGSGLNQEKQTLLTFQLKQKIKFFVSSPADSSDYYSNYVMLLYGLNKKHFSNPKYSLIDFTRELKSFIENLAEIQKWKLAVQRGGYLLFKKTKQDLNCSESHESKQIQDLSKEVKYSPDQKSNLSSAKIQPQPNQKQQSQSQQHPYTTFKQETKPTQQSHHFSPHQFAAELTISLNKITFGNILIQIVPAEQSIQSFKLYQQYSLEIHQKEQTDYASYIDFLCLQALQYRKQPSRPTPNKPIYRPSWHQNPDAETPPQEVGQVDKLLGCYHMKYLLQGKLLAVGVVDMLEHGLSSYYFFYNPAFKQYRLGVFSTLVEIEYVRWMSLTFPEFKYYYMGLYVPNSPKMNYKLAYAPPQLLCPVTYRFVQYDEHVQSKIDQAVNQGDKNLRLSEQDILDDMHFFRDIQPYLNKNLKLTFQHQPVALKNLDPYLLAHILKILKTHVPALGKKVFEMLTFAI